MPASTPVKPSTRVQRPIRSFVLRQGRFTSAQQRAFDEYWPQFGVDFSGQYIDLNELFGRNAPKVLEIGFGNGDALYFAAQHDPARDYLGIEVHAPGVGHLLNILANENIKNVRIYRHDAVEVLEQEIEDGALTEIRIYFPDPWHKKRHHKRRLIQTEFANLLVRKLHKNALLHLATDWEAYAQHMWDILDTTEGLTNCAGPRGYVERPHWRPHTRFEQRGHRLGHGVWDLLYRRTE